MKTISNWFFTWLYVNKLKEHKNSPIKMGTETQTLKSNCIAEIQNTIEHYWLSIKGLCYKLSIKTIQNNTALLYKDEFGKEVKLSNPVFSAVEVARINAKYWLYRLVLMGFSIAETFLYYLVAALFVPGGSEYIKIVVSAFLALLIMFAVDYAFESHFLFRNAADRHSKKELSDAELRVFKDKRNIGYVIIVLSFVAVVFAGLARIFFLENIPANGLSPEKLHSIILASKMASILTLFITIITAIYMAVLKQELAKDGVKFKVYQSWHKANVRRNDYTQQMIRNAEMIKLIAEEKLQKYWQLIIELRRVFKTEVEYDTKFEQLNAEFLILISQPGFVMKDEVYRKFSRIESAHERLFEYGIFNNQGIKEKIAASLEILKIPEKHIAEHTSAQPSDGPERSKDFIPQLPIIGKGKNRSSRIQQLAATSFLLIFFCVLFSSCSSSKQVSMKPLNVISLVDLSDSRDSASIKWYRTTIENSVIGKLGRTDCFQALPIDYNSKTSSMEIFKVDFSKNNYSNEFAGLNAEEVERNGHKTAVDIAIRQFDSCYDVAVEQRKALNQGTDIFGALTVTKKYFREGYLNLIVIFSDMQQYTDRERMNFENHLNQVSEVQHYISIAEKSDLQNTFIIVITGASSISIAKYNVLATFWEQYFISCNGQLVDYSSGAVSVLENYISRNDDNAQ